jgi:DNA-directed RNA polymerase subunit RPC12/RpoP
MIVKNAEEIRVKLARRFDFLLGKGFWFCLNCEREFHQIESEQSQATLCPHCNSYRICFVDPIDKAVET